MKTLVSYLAIAALIIASSFTVSQQKKLNQELVNSCFNRFSVHKIGKANVELTWCISSSDVKEFIVERSYDGDFFDNVTNIGFSGGTSYKTKDAGVYPGVIYYRITAVKFDGATESSSVQTVHIMQRG